MSTYLNSFNPFFQLYPKCSKSFRGYLKPKFLGILQLQSISIFFFFFFFHTLVVSASLGCISHHLVSSALVGCRISRCQIGHTAVVTCRSNSRSRHRSQSFEGSNPESLHQSRQLQWSTRRVLSWSYGNSCNHYDYGGHTTGSNPWSRAPVVPHPPPLTPHTLSTADDRPEVGWSHAYIHTLFKHNLSKQITYMMA